MSPSESQVSFDLPRTSLIPSSGTSHGLNARQTWERDGVPWGKALKTVAQLDDLSMAGQAINEGSQLKYIKAVNSVLNAHAGWSTKVSHLKLGTYSEIWDRVKRSIDSADWVLKLLAFSKLEDIGLVDANTLIVSRPDDISFETPDEGSTLGSAGTSNAKPTIKRFTGGPEVVVKQDTDTGKYRVFAPANSTLKKSSTTASSEVDTASPESSELAPQLNCIVDYAKSGLDTFGDSAFLVEYLLEDMEKNHSLS